MHAWKFASHGLFRTSGRHLYLYFGGLAKCSSKKLPYYSTRTCADMQKASLDTFDQTGSSFLSTVGTVAAQPALWEMPKWNIILEYNVIVYSG